MGLVAAKCPECGANINVDASKDAGICEYCGTAFVSEKAINNYKITSGTVIINAETVNMPTNGPDIEVVKKLLNNGLHRDAKETLDILLEEFPNDPSVLYEYAKYDYNYNGIWLDDNEKFLKAKAVADNDDLEEMTDFRDSEYNKIMQNGQEVIDFCNDPDMFRLNFTYIKVYRDIDNINKLWGYNGFEIEDLKTVLVRYINDERFGWLRCTPWNNITFKPKIIGKRLVAEVLYEGVANRTDPKKYGIVKDGEKSFAVGNLMYISDLTDMIVFNDLKDEMYYGEVLKNKSTQFTEDFINEISGFNKTSKKSGCYIATCVYGSYDCPQVWTLRRFRDYTLDTTWYGRVFIKMYYTISPSLVKWFGNTNWFKRFFQAGLDKMISRLNSKGVGNTFYRDKY